MGRRNVPTHYLRPNEIVWTPPCVITLDSETRIICDRPETHGLRLWVARRTDRRAQHRGPLRDDWADGVTAAQLAAQIDAWAVGRKTVWLYAHNLSFDLATTRLPLQLGALGWEVTQAAIDGRSCWLTMGKGGKTITMADSFTWLPVPLAQIGAAVGIAKPPLPDFDESGDKWLHRCGEDVSILSEAVLQLMAWWDRNALGRWAITGGASGWNAYRHTPTTVKVLIRPDEDQVDFGRGAIYGGRRYVWRHGQLPPGRYTELDFASAYATVAAHLPLPLMRAREFDAMSTDHPYVEGGRWGIVADVEIETDTPRWPVRAGDRVWYPVGRFWTRLAGPDIAEAKRLGCLRQIGHGYVHQLGHNMAPWARWVLSCCADTTGATPEVAKLACKHWGRAVIGKWAQRAFERRRLGLAPTDGWGYGHAWSHDNHAQASILDIGGQRFVSEAAGDSDNCYPEVLAYVEAYVRVALGRVIGAAGPAGVIQCDTDGLIVSEGQAAGVVALQQVCAPFTLRPKRTYRDVRVTGPQHLVLDGERRFSGVPRSAVEGKDGRLHALGWPKLAWQIERGDSRGYVRPDLPYLVQPCYVPAWVLADGAVVPVTAGSTRSRDTFIRPWRCGRHAPAGAQLGPYQHPALGGLWDEAVG